MEVVRRAYPILGERRTVFERELMAERQDVEIRCESR
jgi:hypothetical protein